MSKIRFDDLCVGMQVVIPFDNGMMKDLEFLRSNPVVTIAKKLPYEYGVSEAGHRFTIEEDGGRYHWSVSYIKEIVDTTNFESDCDFDLLFSN